MKTYGGFRNLGYLIGVRIIRGFPTISWDLYRRSPKFTSPHLPEMWLLLDFVGSGAICFAEAALNCLCSVLNG